MSNKPNRISHSSATLYQTCPTRWKYHYRDKLRSKKQNAGLLFGSAMDAAFNARFKDDSKNPLDVFNYNWRFQEVNKQKVYLPTCTDIAYSKTEFDEDLLKQEDLDKYREKYNEDPLTSFYALDKKRETFGFDNFSIEEKERYNFMCWHTLFRKGHLFLEALEKQIVPNIEEVLSVQQQVKLNNSEGDTIIGYADMVCRWKGYTTPIIVDFKTSAREYDKDDVLRSPQLSLYMHDLTDKFQTRLAGFVVFVKRIMKNKTKHCSICDHDGSGTRFKTCNNTIDEKRCDGAWNEKVRLSVWVQVLINEVPIATEELILENMDYINQAIKNGVFHRNLSSCVQPWGKCPYHDLCWHGSDEGLTKV